MAKQIKTLVLTGEDLEIDLDLGHWEVVNRSDGEFSDDSFSLSDDDVISLDDDDGVSFELSPVISPPPEMIPEIDGGEIIPEVDGGGDLTAEMLPEDDLTADLDLDGVIDEQGEEEDDVHIDADEIYENELAWAQRRMIVLRGGSPYSVGVGIKYTHRDVCYDDEDRGSDYYDDSYDVDDDEPVPRNASRKLGRGKVKRTITKVSTSKKTAYAHLKGGVRGKYGLGMKFKY